MVIDPLPSFFTIYYVYRNQWFWLGVPIVEYLPYFAGYTISTLAVVEIIDIGNEGGVYGLLMTVENVGVPFLAVVSKNICANFDIGYDFLQVDDSYARNQVAYTYIISYAFKFFSLVFVLCCRASKSGDPGVEVQHGRQEQALREPLTRSSTSRSRSSGCS